MKHIKRIDESYDSIMSNELDKNWSADYHLNKKSGKFPYIKKDNIFIQIEKGKSIPKNAIYLTPEKVERYNKISYEIKKLEMIQKTILE